MKFKPQILLFTASAGMVFASLVTPVLQAGGWSWPTKSKVTTVQTLARKIDRLEKHIDEYGSVVPKSPDVWGEARLTKYRRMVEKQLKALEGGFQSRINGAISRSDQAYLTSSLALQAAVTGNVPSAPSGPTVLVPTGETVTSVDRTYTDGKITNQTTSEKTLGSSSSSSTPSDSSSDSDTSALDELTKAPTFETNSFRRHTVSFAAGGQNNATIQLEPTVELDQHFRYLKHLNALRRINEGDDTSDAPGYALHLVRIPVSVLPGKKTRQGYGAEVTITAKPHVHDKLLPVTFRQLVVNDLIDQFAFPLAKILDSKDGQDLIKNITEKKKLSQTQFTDEEKFKLKCLKSKLKTLTTLNCNLDVEISKLINQTDGIILTTKEDFDPEKFKEELTNQRKKYKLITESLIKEGFVEKDLKVKNFEVTDVNEFNKYLKNSKLSDSTFFKGLESTSGEFTEKRKLLTERIKNTFDKKERINNVEELKSFEEIEKLICKILKVLSDLREIIDISNLESLSKPYTPKKLSEYSKIINKKIKKIDSEVKAQDKKLKDTTNKIKELTAKISTNSGSSIPVATFRRSQLPFPPSQGFDIYGKDNLVTLLLFANRIKSDTLNQEQVLLLDLQKLLKEELHSAFNLLKSDFDYWSLCTQRLAHAIRHHNVDIITQTRSEFYDLLRSKHIPIQDGHDIEKSHVAILAWSVIVESALLNERLIEDMRELSAAKNAFHLNTEWMPFYLPEPPMEAVAVFNDYVRCRWPIHVFAIDPVSEDQNIADSFTQRREMQLAMSMALVGGNVNASQFTRFARRTELSMDAIGINRTVVGFSHGDDTFGWRFYPRFQTPPTPGTATVFFRDLLMGGPKRDHLLNKRMLEPGTRECTALVIMPSFVPYAIFDTRTNWFKLSNPSKKEFNLSDTVTLSKDITDMRILSKACKKDAHLYRKDEVYRLNRAVEQLDRRLPLQTKYVQVPHENSHGGFEFFNNGVTDLAPELKGFYGEPGVIADSNKVELINLAASNINTDGTTTASENNITTGRDIFLVGDNFSVHETNVIAGNQSVNFELLSRQIMRVTIPATVRSIPLNGDKKTKIVDVHVATPYGISNHLSIPVIESIAEKNEEEMKKVATAVVDSALQDKMATVYDWKTVPKNTQIALKYDGQNLKCFDIPDDAGSLEIERKTSSKEIKKLFSNFPVDNYELAFWITVSSSNADVETKKFPYKLSNTCKIKHKLSDLSTLLEEVGDFILGPQCEIEKEEDKIRIPLSHQANKISLEGYVRHDNDGNPVNKLVSKIEIAVKIKELEKCVKEADCKGSSVSSCTVTPFDKFSRINNSKSLPTALKKDNSGYVHLNLNDPNRSLKKQAMRNSQPQLLFQK